MTTVLVREFPAPEFSMREALRYAGCRAEDAPTRALAEDCWMQARAILQYRVCYAVCDLQVQGSACCFPGFTAESQKLAENLRGCRQALVFAATVGPALDRLIARYGHVSPSHALMLQAIGAERAEALCDAFSRWYCRETGVGLRPRFSPGYGDLPLCVQKDIFSLLDCPRRIGLTLNESLLMSPSKSVTAFAGITDTHAQDAHSACARCENADCLFRSET